MLGEERSNQEHPPIEPDAVLKEVRDLVEQLEPGKGRGERVRLDSALGRELGIDSLGRAELLQRLEDRFDVSLPERVITDAESPRDLWRAVLAASPASRLPGDPLAREAAASRWEGETEREPMSAPTLPEVVGWHAARHGDRRHVLFLERGPGEGPEQELTYSGLRERARGVASGLQGLGLDPGDAVGLMLPSGLDYFVCFLAIQIAGCVPVPLYPPARKSQLEDHLVRQAGILSNARARLLVTFEEVKPLSRLVSLRAPELRRIVTPEDLRGDREACREAPITADDVAFLQYTSGSTGEPKGVVLTHANLLANLRSMGEILAMRDDDVVISWLPLYHDMGLIGAWMGSLYFGVPLVLMSPLAFLTRPARWLRAVHRYRGTISAAPNFAYELCLAKIGPEEVQGLDLSSWRMALNGAEPVSPRSVEEFPARFAPLGLSPRVMMPVYGLAEGSLAVAFTPPDAAPKIDAVDRETFQRERRAVPANAGDERPLRIVCCGRPIPGHEVRFVGSDGREVGEREEGRLQFRGPSTTSGYFRNPEATGRLLQGDGWLDSGDLGYAAAGEVYLTGRVKDVIIRAGRNVYPQEVEDAVGDLEGVRRGCVAVFAVQDEAAGTEGLVVLAETRIPEADAEERSGLRERVRSIAFELTGTDPDDVALVPPGTIPKTSSGKLRRSTARELYESGRLGASGRAVWLQLASVALSGVVPALRRLRGRILGLGYSIWFWSVVGLVAVPVWLVTVLTPGLHRRRRLVRFVARALARVTRTSLQTRGLEALEQAADPRVVVANHASYLDGFVLTAVLPPRCAYVVKGELEANPLARALLSRLGCVFVERFDAARGEAESEKAGRALARGDHLVIFPEATFQRAPGLMPFRMGAFVVAARSRKPIVPVVIRGTRSKLRGGTAFPRPGDVQIEGRLEIVPAGETWEDAVALRNAVRAEILARAAEPDLG